MTTYAEFLAARAAEPPPVYALRIDVTGKNYWSVDEFDAEFEGRPPLSYIYGLWDPRTGELRYVGKSDNPTGRLANQMNERSNTYRCHWLQELRHAGLMPIQKIIDAVHRDCGWRAMEIGYIAGAKAAGCRLTNATIGGDGIVGLPPEVRERIRLASVGRKQSPEVLARLSAIRKGRRHTHEARDHMRQVMQGREFTTEWRQKIRAGVQKLTDDQVRDIRKMLARKVSQYVIAEQFGVHQGSISNIARGITYKDVQ